MTPCLPAKGREGAERISHENWLRKAPLALRKHGLNGWKFRRQQVIGEFIVDFYCHQAGLIIELDGGLHQDPDQQAYDKEREKVLAARGLRLLRITNERVAEELEYILAEIESACEQCPNQPGEESTPNLLNDSSTTDPSGLKNT